MATITLELPDDIAAQLRFDPTYWPAFLREAIAAKLAQSPPAASRPLATLPVYQEIVDFLASGPTPGQVAKFKISPTAQDRLEDLLFKNREQTLLPEERAEMDTYIHFSHLITRLKARARDKKPLAA